MVVMEPGRVCLITRGADAGRQAVIKQVVDKNFVIIVGEKVKERRANIMHLEPTGNKVLQIPAGPAPKTKAEATTVGKIIKKVRKEQKTKAA